MYTQKVNKSTYKKASTGVLFQGIKMLQSEVATGRVLFTGTHLCWSHFLIKSLKETNFNSATTSQLTFTFKYSEALNNISENSCGYQLIIFIFF